MGSRKDGMETMRAIDSRRLGLARRLPYFYKISDHPQAVPQSAQVRDHPKLPNVAGSTGTRPEKFSGYGYFVICCRDWRQAHTSGGEIGGKLTVEMCQREKAKEAGQVIMAGLHGLCLAINNNECE